MKIQKKKQTNQSILESYTWKLEFLMSDIIGIALPPMINDLKTEEANIHKMIPTDHSN